MVAATGRRHFEPSARLSKGVAAASAAVALALSLCSIAAARSEAIGGRGPAAAGRQCVLGSGSRFESGAMRLRGGKDKEPKEPKMTAKAMKEQNDQYSDIKPPKKAMSGYMLFANDVRAKVAEENPTLKMVELSSKISEKWSAISPEDKTKYEQKAVQAKEQYEKDKADYEAKVPANVRKARDQAKAQKKANKKNGLIMGKSGRLKDPNAPKKSLSAFMIYATKMRPKVKAANPDLGFGDLTRRIAEDWAKLSDKDKEVYNKEAAEAREKYLMTKAKYDSEKAASAPPPPPPKEKKEKKDKGGEEKKKDKGGEEKKKDKGGVEKDKKDKPKK